MLVSGLRRQCRVLPVMFITVSTAGGERVMPLEVPADQSVENVKVLLEVETGIPHTSQILKLDGRVLADGHSVTEAGIKDGDVLLVMQAPAPAAATAPGTSSAAAGGSSTSGVPAGLGAALTWEMVPGEVMKNPGKVHALVREYPHLLEVVKGSNPEFHKAASDSDPGVLRKYYMAREMKRATAKLKEEALRARLAVNPMDLEAQRELAETIRKANVDANMELALEHTPESFGRVTMLYVDAEVNGHPLKAFVDSGAQSTIMSQACAQRCGIMHLLDTRFAGTAVGVGSAPILGRVHMAQLRIGGTFFPCTFTVLAKDDMDFLFGLDMLKRYRGVIDLRANTLRLEGANGEEAVPFLGEKDVPSGSFGSSPAPAPSTAASAQAPAPAQGSGGDRAGAVQNLMALGFPQAAVEAALESTGGDASQAATLLLAGSS